MQFQALHEMRGTAQGVGLPWNIRGAKQRQIGPSAPSIQTVWNLTEYRLAPNGENAVIGIGDDDSGAFPRCDFFRGIAGSELFCRKPAEGF